MSKPKFTPGPWEQYAGHIYAPGDKGANIASVSSPRKSELVGYSELRVGDPDSKEAFANAALIASAPELYGALYDIRMSNAGSEQRKRGWDNAIAALEKAVKP